MQKVLDLGINKTHSFVFPGTDLFATLSPAHYQLTEAKCRIIIAQIVEALEYLHKKRVCHLDIKPNNIIFQSLDPASLQIRLAL